MQGPLPSKSQLWATIAQLHFPQYQFRDDQHDQ
jgi:hypothetical protein